MLGPTRVTQREPGQLNQAVSLVWLPPLGLGQGTKFCQSQTSFYPRVLVPDSQQHLIFFVTYE